MIIIKTDKEIEMLRRGGKVLANIFQELKSMIKPGVTTGDLEKAACELIQKAGGRPSFKGYKTKINKEFRVFPTAVCTSINSEVVHASALPSRQLKAGDIIGLDIGMEYPFKPNGKKGYFTDMAETIAVGEINRDTKKLIDVTRESLELATRQIKSGNTLNDVGGAIQRFVERNGFSVVQDLVGHGVGKEVHEDPPVPNFAIKNEKQNTVLKTGMVLAIEPMVNMGASDVKVASDGLTVITRDGKLSAHFEHTVAVTDTGCEVLTKIKN